MPRDRIFYWWRAAIYVLAIDELDIKTIALDQAMKDSDQYVRRVAFVAPGLPVPASR